MKNDDKGFCHIFIIGVLAVMDLREGAFPDIMSMSSTGSVLDESLGSGSPVGLGGMMIVTGAMFHMASDMSLPCCN